MSTEINIKKKISILEESVAITTDVKSIDFVGTGVVASTIGDDVTVTINENVLFFNSYSAFPVTGLDGFMYVDNTGNIAYLWDTVTSTYVVVGAGPVIPPDPSPIAFANAVTTAVLLYAPIYYNGLANDGVGATLTATANGIVSDGSLPNKIDTTYTPIVNDIVLVKNQALQKQNGLYEITIVGSASTTYLLTRVGDYDETSELYPLQVNVLPGGSNGLTLYNQTTVNPIVGTSNIVFLTTSASNGYVIPTYFVDTVTTAALPTCVYANGTIYPVTIPGYLATLTASVNGALGTINGLTASVSTIPALSFSRLLVKNQVNPAHNGSYVVINAGSATTKWILRRIHYTSTAFDRYSQNFMVSNTGSTKIGKYYFTSPNVPILTNATVGTAAINILEYGGSAAGLIYITNQTTGVVTYYTTLELARDGSVSGDTIYVNPGTYVVTTTAANGLSKSGVDWFFQSNAFVSKATSGHIFSDNGFALNANVYGQGLFTKTTTTGNIFYNTLGNASFEARAVISSIDDCFVTTTASNLYFNVNRANSSGGRILHIAGYSTSRIKIDMVSWKSTAANCIGGATWWYNTDVKVNGGLLESTTAQAVGNYNSGVVLDLNVTKILGVTYAIASGDGSNGYPNIINCSYCTGISDIGKNYILNGQFGALSYVGSNGAFVNGGRFSTITLSGGGHVITTLGTNLTLPSTGTITQSSGVLDVTIDTFHYGIGFNITGGVCNIVNQSVQNQLSGALDRIVNGGTLNLYTNFIHGGNPDSGVWYAIKLQSGTLRLLASVRNNFNTAASNIGAHGIVWVGGKLIIDRSTIYITDTVALPIQATTAGLSLRVLTGGLSTNITADGGVLPGKKMKYKFTISAIAATGINILIPTSYNISESNTGVYNTKALLAQRMAALINGSPFLNVAVIATQDIPGTDEYFYIETLTAGPTFSYNTPVNFSAITIQRWNSYAITNITGGSILENSNVE